MSIFTFKDLLEHFPFRHIDRTKVNKIREINGQTDYIQVAGKLISFDIVGQRGGRRLVAQLKDDSGILELTWFQGIQWIQKGLVLNKEYLVFGRAGFYMGKPQITHPEMEILTTEKPEGRNFLEPVYPVTEKLKSRGLNSRNIGKLTFQLLSQIDEKDLPENLPEGLVRQFKFPTRFEAFRHIHFPTDNRLFQAALNRLKFEEFFWSQMRLGMIRSKRHRFSKGFVFGQVGDLFNRFYREFLPFELTGAQKRVLKEIRQDTARGRQMNRLLQGDVGSGKTIVALLTMLLALDNGYQSCLMAPTEILAQQHYNTLTKLLEPLKIEVGLLTGSLRSSGKKELLSRVADGTLPIVVGTHALIEEQVTFNNLGLAIVDEQHRFGVAQRARLWEKGEVPPHMLVMTATPIPRTLAMTAYGDLDYSVMDELPPGRLPVKTVHRTEKNRHQVMQFIKDEIEKGRQVYIIFPLIEESEKLNYENLMKGYENVKAYFPEPRYWISMVHGRMKADQKEMNMQRFVRGETQIMVSTTVIEVGVNVPNATVMVIESAEKFGLSQLHQLRGRVGRGSDKSFCILLTGEKVSNDARERLKMMCATNDGFKIAEKDLEIRGPGEIDGTRQSGMLNFKLVRIVEDRSLLEISKKSVEEILSADPDLEMAEHERPRLFLQQQSGKTVWSRIS